MYNSSCKSPGKCNTCTCDRKKSSSTENTMDTRTDFVTHSNAKRHGSYQACQTQDKGNQTDVNSSNKTNPEYKPSIPSKIISMQSKIQPDKKAESSNGPSSPGRTSQLSNDIGQSATPTSGTTNVLIGQKTTASMNGQFTTKACLNSAAKDYAVFVGDSSLRSTAPEFFIPTNGNRVNKVIPGYLCLNNNNNNGTVHPSQMRSKTCFNATEVNKTVPVFHVCRQENLKKLSETIQESDTCRGATPQKCPTCENIVFTSNSRENYKFTWQEKSCDLVMQVEGMQLYVHSEVLSGWSTRWRHLIRLCEADPNTGLDRIILEDVKLQAILDLLRYIYGVHKLVTETNVFSLLELSHRFDMPKITQECETFLLHLTPTLNLLVVAQNYHLQTLFQSCIQEVTKLSIRMLEHDPLFKELNVTTASAIYKVEIAKLHEDLKVSSQEKTKLQKDVMELKLYGSRTRSRLRAIQQVWMKKGKKCIEHSEDSAFDFSCADCNEKINKEVQHLCMESVPKTSLGMLPDKTLDN